MIRYVIRRLLWMIVIALAVAFVIFTITYFTPGDPAQLGLDKGYMAQLADYFYNTFIKLDLGVSWNYKVPVLNELLSRLPRTVGMGMAGIILANGMGIPLGILAAFLEVKRWLSQK